MNIGINAYEANVTHRVGSNQYAYRMLVELEKLAQNDEVAIYLASKPLKDMPAERAGWRYTVLKPTVLWSQWRLPLELYIRALTGKKFDVFFSLGHYTPRFCPFPSVMCIMDLAFVKFPEFFKKTDLWKLKTWTDYSVKQAQHIITISEQSKRDILEFYHLTADQVTVAYPGFDVPHPNTQTTRVLEALKVQQPYIVYVGTIQPRKNLIRLVKAFELLTAKPLFRNLRLVIGGKIGWLADEFLRTVQHSPVQKRIQVLGFVTEEQKLALYAKAKAAVLVGLYEGFGIPPLEAMAVGTIPVVAETASLPEVVGPGGILVDPYSIEDIARGLQEAIEWSGSVREEKLATGRQYMKKFSWEHSARLVLDVLHGVGNTTMREVAKEGQNI